jgi:predicted ATPase/DNA-binding SARP family transcriptional activator
MNVSLGSLIFYIQMLYCESKRLEMLEVRLIGKFDIQCDGKPVTISSRAAQSLFAYLILNPGASHRREKLAGMFWPDATEEKARAYLRHELWRIRKAFPPQSKVDFLLADDINITINSSAEYWLDVATLTNVSEAASIESLRKALSVFQGEFLPGFYDDWVTQEREQLQSIYEQKIARLLELLESKKCWNDILEWAERWISLGQEPEAAYRSLMIAYDALGDRAKVASTYERCAQALRVLDFEPSEQTRALAFKRNPKLNIPIPLTSFIGREKELKEVSELLSKSRLVTLTGSGGVGKTRLAIQVIAEVLDISLDGVWFLDLAPLSDPSLVPNTVASLLGLRESGEVPITDLLINYFRARTALVIFDNCEHLIESCAQLINSLLASCQNLSILATSREGLRVSGEIPYRVPSLEVPKPDIEFAIDEISSIESVQLFAERAAVALLGFTMDFRNVFTIAQICQRLDGIPLAIELAAARVNVLSVEQILERLDDRFNLLTSGLRTALPRHQTLHAMIEWSYELLSEKECILFRRLAIFIGGWTLEATEHICCKDGIESGEVLELLSQLVNKSLVMVETMENETRYRMLETVRQFARKNLIESGEEENICTHHLEYFLHLSEQAEPLLRGPAQMEWYARLNNERDNIRAALEWADKTSVEKGLYLSGRLGQFWEEYDLREGERWLGKFLQAPEAYTYPHARAKALYAYGIVLNSRQQFSLLEKVAEECLSLYRANSDQAGEIDSLILLAISMSTSYNSPWAIELTKQALNLSESIGDKWRKGFVFAELGWLGANYENKALYWNKAIALFREVGDLRLLEDYLGVLGDLEMLNGNFEAAQKHLDEAIQLHQSLKRKGGMGFILNALSRVEIIKGNFENARSLLEEDIAIQKDLGHRMKYLWDCSHLGYISVHQGRITEARNIFFEMIQEFFKDKDEMGVGYSLEGMAGLCVAAGKPEEAAWMIGWADATREKIGDTRPPLEQADVDKILAACLLKIGEAPYSKAYDEGKKMTLDEAVAYTLQWI